MIMSPHHRQVVFRADGGEEMLTISCCHNRSLQGKVSEVYLLLSEIIYRHSGLRSNSFPTSGTEVYKMTPKWDIEMLLGKGPRLRWPLCIWGQVIHRVNLSSPRKLYLLSECMVSFHLGLTS